MIYHPINCGKGATLHTGFAAATGDVVNVPDADQRQMYLPNVIRDNVPFE